MCNPECIRFIESNLNKDDIKGKSVLEVGALNVNGSPRSFIEKFEPKKYLGIDIFMGDGVDEICKVEDLVETYGKESFDIVITTELLEHVREWRIAISNLKNILKLEGKLLITTRSRGQMYHGYPYDFWRYEVEDMKEIFSDMEIIKNEKDPLSPGVFVKVKKNRNFKEFNIDNINLFSIIIGKRTKSISDLSFIYSKLILMPLAFLYERLIPSFIRKSFKKIMVKDYRAENLKK